MKRIIKSKPKLESDEISANPIGRLMNQPIVTEVQNSYLDYAMSVIISRALPDVRDGLKPVHRRILYAMWHMGLKPQAKQRKSATVVGEVLGKYHPHGDVAVYDTLVRLAQDFSMRYPMVMGQGNFGCFTGDTKIKLLDGTEGSFEQLAKDFKPDQKFAVYSVNKESEIIVGLAHHSRITRKNAEIIELTLNTGEKIRCTPDHRFLLNNGTYKSAKKLTIKDILLEQAQTYNHRVVSIKKIKEKFDVWDITVDEYHNFLLADGVFVHNSLDGDSAAAMRYCVTGDTLIPTDKGMIPIEKISENQSEDIQIKILSKNKIINNATKWFDSGVHPTIKITTQHGFTLTGTANHPILTWSKDALTGEPIFQWKLLEKIQENDVAVLDRNADLLWSEQLLDIKKFRPQLKNKRRQIKTLPNKMDENLAHILGALLVEGTIKQNEIEFCNSDSEWIDDFKNRWQKVFPDCRLHCFSRAPNSFGKKPYYTLEIHSRFVVEFLKNLGLEPVKSKEKTVPFTIFQSPKKVAAAFLQAYFEGDGSISFSSKMTELSCCSVSEKLIAQTQLILLRFGITGTKRYDSYRKTHKLYLRGLQNYLAFQQEINFLSNLKTNKLNKAIARIHKDSSQTDFIPFVSSFTRSLVADFPECNWDKKEFAYKHNFDHYPNIIKNGAQVCTAVKPTLKIEMQILFEMLIANNYLFDSIVKIEKGITQKVYSLRVASECHSFVGNGFINHNTECKLANISEEILTDIERDTVNFTPNYDGMHLEPTVLPARLPNLLLNGTIGIAVGMATSIPPHNLGELCSAINHLIEHPDADVEDLTEFVKGPDFPTGGIIYDKKEITQAYATGRGRVVTRAKTEIVEDKNGLYKIIVHEIPYQINKATLVEKIADLVHEKKIEGIKDLRDESNKDGVRIVIELKK
ncbi:MAG: hypothetical protein HZC05_01665, partial [Candidatus Magasanikbacteria bacterium]|nr:hypothetical protein [Candidatus Magasanikbacteria bacterium]